MQNPACRRRRRSSSARGRGVLHNPHRQTHRQKKADALDTPRRPPAAVGTHPRAQRPARPAISTAGTLASPDHPFPRHSPRSLPYFVPLSAHGDIRGGGRGYPGELPAEGGESLPVLHRRSRRPRARRGVRDHEGLGGVAERRRREGPAYGCRPSLPQEMRTGQGCLAAPAFQASRVSGFWPGRVTAGNPVFPAATQPGATRGRFTASPNPRSAHGGFRAYLGCTPFQGIDSGLSYGRPPEADRGRAGPSSEADQVSPKGDFARVVAIIDRIVSLTPPGRFPLAARPNLGSASTAPSAGCPGPGPDRRQPL